MEELESMLRTNYVPKTADTERCVCVCVCSCVNMYVCVVCVSVYVCLKHKTVHNINEC